MPAAASHVLAKRFECARGSWSSSAGAAPYRADKVNLCACRITAATFGLDDSNLSQRGRRVMQQFLI